MKVICRGLAVVAALMAGGCASIMDSSSQSVTISPMYNGRVVTESTCTASNKKGSWVTAGGMSVNVKKASDDLQVSCVSHSEQGSSGQAAAPRSTRVGYAIANFFIWDFCTISCIIDFSSGAIYKYPVQLVVPMLPAQPLEEKMSQL